jgi:small subunit ribosomal protein S21
VRTVRQWLEKLWPSGPSIDLIERKRTVQVFVRDNNVDQALRALKKKMQREGLFREMRLRKHYEKRSERRVRENWSLFLLQCMSLLLALSGHDNHSQQCVLGG